jgi:hypothetical protein
MASADGTGVRKRAVTPPPAVKQETTCTEKASATIEFNARKQTRPMGEFYGNTGTCFWTFFIPLAIYYFYGIMVMHQGRLVIPNYSFWYDLLFTLPAGLSIMPTFYATAVSFTWVACQAAGEIFLPATIVEGVTLKNGNRLLYPMNGLKCFFLSNVSVFMLGLLGIIKPYFVFENMGALLTEAVLTSYAMAIWLYVDFGLLWQRHTSDPEFEEDHGVFSTMDMWNDFFMGVVRNPRPHLLRNLGKVPFDLKRFWNARPGLTGWVILNISYLASIYYGCKLPSLYNAGDDLMFGSHPTTGNKFQSLFNSPEPLCKDPAGAFAFTTGDFSNIGIAAVFITLAHWYYIFDYNLVEPAYLTTTDIRHDLFGFMLTYGDWGFLSRYYPISFMGFLAVQGSAGKGFISGSNFYAFLGIGMYLLGMLLFRITNIEKHLFRDFMNNGGQAEKYRSPLSTRIFFGDKKVEFIKTKEGNLLLTSGFWGLARHFNYVGDLTMCIGWAIACYNPGSPFPWLPISYCIYFWLMDCHRCWRDEVRCSKKYKEDWIKYKEAVPYAILPYVW